MERYLRRVRIGGLFNSSSELIIDFTNSFNCIYGENGTGKTVLINLIVDSLSVSTDGLRAAPFEYIELLLAKRTTQRATKFLRVDKEQGAIFYTFHSDIELSGEAELKSPRYQSSVEKGKRYRVTKRVSDDSPESRAPRIGGLRRIISSMVSLTYIPLLRMREIPSHEPRYLRTERTRRKYVDSDSSLLTDPNDMVLESLEEELRARYAYAQTRLSVELEELKTKIFEKLFLDSDILDSASPAVNSVADLFASQDAEVGKEKIESVLQKISDLKLDIPEVKVRQHYAVWETLRKNLLEAEKHTRKEHKNEEERQKSYSEYSDAYYSYLASTNLYSKFEQAIEEIDLKQKEKLSLFSIFDRYVSEVNKFLSETKKVSFNGSGGLEFTNHGVELPLNKLSSGEKHILAILGRVCLSTFKGPSTFIADEPELSLHLSWQREVLPSIQRISPDGQIIVATHSPAIIPDGSNLIDIERCYKDV